MSALEKVLPTPRLVEVDRVDLAASPERVWEIVRHGELGRSWLIKALFAIRTLPERFRKDERARGPILRIDALTSSPAKPGFQVLADDAPHELVVGAIGKVWRLDIPFLHMPDAAAFTAYGEEGWIKVAWAFRLFPSGARDTRLELEVRVTATDDRSWRKFRRYFRFIGPGSHIIRRSLLSSLERELGAPGRAAA